MKNLEKFQPMGGHHCITNSLKQIFSFYGKPISEEMLFGLGRGLGFVYINLNNAPMISGRIKPIEFEENIADAINVEIKIKKSKNRESAMEKLKSMVASGRPVMLYGDMAYLKYMNLDENSHFGGHSIVVYGYDDKDNFYVSDRDNSNWKIHTPKGEIGEDFHLVTYDELIKARSSTFRPFPPNNSWVEFDFSNIKEIDSDIIIKAVRQNLEEMLNPPAQLLGINGIRKFSKEIRKWKEFSIEKLKLAVITNYFMISKDGGTGGGAFRKMYGNFLIEASRTVTELEKYGLEYKKIGSLWDDVGEGMMAIYNKGEFSIIEELSEKIAAIGVYEEKIMKEIVLELSKLN